MRGASRGHWVPIGTNDPCPNISPCTNIGRHHTIGSCNVQAMIVGVDACQVSSAIGLCDPVNPFICWYHAFCRRGTRYDRSKKDRDFKTFSCCLGSRWVTKKLIRNSLSV